MAHSKKFVFLPNQQQLRLLLVHLSPSSPENDIPSLAVGRYGAGDSTEPVAVDDGFLTLHELGQLLLQAEVHV